MEFGANYFGVTIAGMTPAQFREIVFEIVPRKVTCNPSVAGEIVDELRAFFSFLKREHGLRSADACLRVLEGDAAKRVEQALSDPRNFGMAKSIMMAGVESGFDMSTPDGATAWMREIQGRPLPSSIPLPPVDLPPARASISTEAQRTKKNKRKAERKARRKIGEAHAGLRTRGIQEAIGRSARRAEVITRRRPASLPKAEQRSHHVTAGPRGSRFHRNHRCPGLMPEAMASAHQGCGCAVSNSSCLSYISERVSASKSGYESAMAIACRSNSGSTPSRENNRVASDLP
jgi:hypothetical protein